MYAPLSSAVRLLISVSRIVYINDFLTPFMGFDCSYLVGFKIIAENIELASGFSKLKSTNVSLLSLSKSKSSMIGGILSS